METLKCNDFMTQDPDYSTLFNTNVNRQNVFENNARANTANKISAIIEAEFLNEINNKKLEIFKIYKNLNKACKTLHYLRFAIITDFYNKENNCIDDAQSLKQLRPHNTIYCANNNVSVTNFKDKIKFQKSDTIKRKQKVEDDNNVPKKKCLPYDTKLPITFPILVANSKTRKRIIVGNISKWIPPDFREDNASHKWTIYVRDSQRCDLGQFISKVRFFLHPSYKPNDVVELTSTPFHLSRLGWGEFPVRVQLHFANSFDKAVDIIHHLKLDKTFTGLQTIGSETIVDIWINMKNVPTAANSEIKNIEKIKLVDDNCVHSNLSNFYYFLNDHDYTGQSLRFDKEISCKFKQLGTMEQSESNKYQEEAKFAQVLKSENLNMVPQDKLSNISEDEALDIISINNEKEVQTSNNSSNLLNESDVNSKNIYFKKNSVIGSIEDFELLNRFVNDSKPNNLSNILKFIVNRMPFITEKSIDSRYKTVHPYACLNHQVFNSYSKGKQRSLERYWAIDVLNILKNIKGYNDVCTINQFITWARRYCYIPFVNLKTMHKICILSDSVNMEENSKRYKCTSTISAELNKLFCSQKINPSIINFDYDSDKIDIINISNINSSSLSTNYSNKLSNNHFLLLEYPKVQNCLKDYVCKSAQEVGIKIINEEIIPGVSHATASLLISKAVECLIEELIRLAFSCALDKCKANRNSISIHVEDVRMALLKKEQFDIFINAGLGSEG